MRERSVLRTSLANPALHQLEFRGQRIQFLACGNRFRLVMFTAEQSRLLFGFCCKQPLQVALSVEEADVNTAPDLVSGFAEHFEERTSPPSLACNQRGLGKPAVGPFHIEAHQELDVEILKIPRGSEERCPQSRACDFQ